MTVKCLFFDLGSTLIDERKCYKMRFREAVEGTQISADEFEQKVIEFAKQGLKGDHEAVRYFGLKLPPWHKEAEKPYSCTKAVLEYLTAKGYRLGVIANQSAGTKERLSAWGLLRYFDVVLSSAEEGVKKPDEEIFRRALALAECAPEDAAMVGDRLDNDIAPAAKLGMKTVWVRQGFCGLASVTKFGQQPDIIIGSIEEILKLF